MEYALLGLIVLLFITHGTTAYRLRKRINEVEDEWYRTSDIHFNHLSKLSKTIGELAENYEQYRVMNCEDLQRLHEQLDGLDNEFDNLIKSYLDEQNETFRKQQAVFDGFQNILDYDYEKAMKGASK